MGRTLSVDHLLIGAVGGMQPDKLVASFEGDHDGKYARVLFAWPDEPRWLGLNNDADEIEADICTRGSRTPTLAELTQEGRLVSHSIGLDPEAAERFAQFAQFAHREKSAFEGREREWFAKATAHVLRLANTLTYVEWALTTYFAKPGPTTRPLLRRRSGWCAIISGRMRGPACGSLASLKSTLTQGGHCFGSAPKKGSRYRERRFAATPVATAGRRRDHSLAGGAM